MTEEWYYAQNEQQMGPISTVALREMLAKGSVKSSDLVWCDGMSNWAPAADLRELFPTPRTAVASVPLPPPAAEPPTLRPQRRFDAAPPRDRWDERRPIRRQPPRGMSTGAKVAIFGGIAALLVVGFMVIIGIIAVAATSNSATRYSSKKTFGGGNPPPPPAAGRPGFVGIQPVQSNTYIVDLKFEKDQNERLVQWKANQKVRVTVNPTERKVNAFGEFDVDVYIYDGTGQLIALDNFPDADCDVTFVVPTAGQYRIVVVLDRGTSAKCTVRY